MSFQSTTKIQILWEKFLQSECVSYERSAWFDAFLCEFLIHFKDGNSVQDIMPFTSLSGVATLISCELLSDVHQICSQPGDGDDLAPLRRHLLRGRGWRTLAVLHCLGIKDVTCGSELASLLISLYPVCLQIQQPAQSARKSGLAAIQNLPTIQTPSTCSVSIRNPYILLNCSWELCTTPSGLTHMTSRHGHRSAYQLPGVARLSPGGVSHFRRYSTPSSRSTSGGHNSVHSGTNASHQRVEQLKNVNNAASRQRRRSRNAMEPDCPKTKCANATSESEAPHDAKLLINKSNTLKIRLNPMDFDYFESVVRSDDDRDQEDRSWRNHGRRSSRKLTVEDLTDDAMREVRAQTVTPGELSQLIIHLVQDLCRSESPISTRQICLEAVNFALENLCSLQFGSTTADALSASEDGTATLEAEPGEVDRTESPYGSPVSGIEARAFIDSIRVITRKMSADLGIQSLSLHLGRLENLFENFFPSTYNIETDPSSYGTDSRYLDDVLNYPGITQNSALNPPSRSASEPRNLWRNLDKTGVSEEAASCPEDARSVDNSSQHSEEPTCIYRSYSGEATDLEHPKENERHFEIGQDSELSTESDWQRESLSRIPEEFGDTTDVKREIEFVGEECCSDHVSTCCSWMESLGLHDELTVADLKLTISHLLLTALDRVLHPEVITALISAGVLPVMLRVLEDAVRKTEAIAKAATVSALTAEQERTAEGLQELVMGILYGVATFLHCLLLHRTSTEKIHEFEEQFRLFASSNGSRLIEKTVTALLNCYPNQREASVNKARKVVTLVGQLILSLKQARGILVHSLQCRKTRHKHCKEIDAKQNHHHHNNLFGIPVATVSTSAVSASIVAQGGPCNVAYLFAALVRILSSHIQNPDVALPLMKVMVECGTCCCFPAKALLICLAKLLHSGSTKVRALGFVLLERTVFMELGAIETTKLTPNKDNFRCSVCNGNVQSVSARSSVVEDGADDIAADVLQKNDQTPKENDLLESYSSDRSDSLGLQDGNCLDFYRDLLCSNVPKLCHTAATHLLKLAPRCNERVQLALMTNVFFPSFLRAKERYLEERSDIPKFILLSCLSAFSCLMCSPSLAEQFLVLDGLKHVLEMMELSPFLKMACAVLEIIITLDVQMCGPGLPEDWKRGGTDDQLLKIASLKYLVQSIENRSNELLEKLHGPDSDGDRRERLRLLHNVGALWRSAMNLSLCNPQLRGFFANQPVMNLGFQLLQALFRRVVTFASLQGSAGSDVLKEFKCYLYMRLMEAILVLHFTSSSFSLNKDNLPSNEVLINDLRKTLCHNEMGTLRQTVTGVKTMRWLCDVLIHCSVAEPYNEAIIPALRKKPTSFMIASVWDSDQLDDDKQDQNKINSDQDEEAELDEAVDREALSEDSGSSVEEPYVTADEGYEADVEVLEMGRGLSVLSDSESSCNMGGQPKPSGKDDTVINLRPARRTNPHNIVHPQLCLLTVDVLVFINNCKDVLSDEIDEDSDSGESGIAGGGGGGGREGEFAGSSEGIDDDSPSPSGSEHNNPLVHTHLITDQIEIIQRLIALCRDNTRNCIALSQCGVISSLLSGFSRALSTRDDSASALQVVILELITLLAQHSITSNELGQYLSFFKTKSPPLEALLQPLVTLVTSARPQPNFILCFPVADVIEVNASTDSSPSTPTAGPPHKKLNLFRFANIGSGWSNQRKSQEGDVPENAASSLAQALRKQHIAEGFKSCWSQCAVALPIDSNLGWAIWMQGYSLSMWIRGDRPTEDLLKSTEGATATAETRNNVNNVNTCMSDNLSESWSDWGIISSNSSWLNDDEKSNRSKQSGGKFLHVVSVGTDNLVLELWLNVVTDSFHLRLTRSDSKTCLLVAEAVFDSCLAPGQWHHMAMNVRDTVKTKKTIIEVTTIIDGCHEMKSPLVVTGPLIRKPKPCCVLIGHTAPAQTPIQGQWYLSSLQLFRNPVFTRERAVYVVGLGPSYWSLTDCRVGRENPNFTNMFGTRALLTGVCWDAILDSGNANLREAQDSILLSYSAQNPNVVNVYPQVANNSLFSGQSGLRVIAPEHRASQQLPLPLQPVLMVPLHTQQYRGLVAAISILGGASVFIFLFARVVELNGTEVEQARALFLLLKLVQSDTLLFSQFVQNEYHKLLLKVLSSSRCTPGYHVLKAVLDACCDKAVLQHQPGPQCQFKVVHQSEAIVVNSFLLSTIVGSWQDWERVGATDEDGGVLGTLFRALHVLLRDDHIYREFNAAQLNRVRLVEALLLFCKERFLYEEGRPLHPSVCVSLVELVRSLMGAPPEFSHVVAVADCLLLQHPASATYITHMRPSYYFLLSPSPPEPSPQVYSRKGHPANFMYGDLESLKKKPGKRKSGSKAPGRRASEDTTTIDPAKLNKALKNLKTKRNKEEFTSESSGRSRSLPVPGSSQENESYPESAEYMDTSNLSSVVGSVTEPSVIAEGLVCLDKELNGEDVLKEEENIEKAAEHDYNTDTTEMATDVEAEMKAEAAFKSTKRPSAPSPPAFELPQEEWPALVEQKEKQLTLDWTSSACGESAPPAVEPDDRPIPDSTGMKEDAANMQALVMEGLLLLLRDTLRILPDNMASQVLNHVVQAEMLLVMANNSNVRVRTAVVKVLGAYLQRSSDEEINKFLKLKGFYQLASQLGLYPATKELVEATAALVMQRAEVSLDDLVASLAEKAEAVPMDFSPVQLAAMPPLLALLPRMNHDIDLTHTTMLLLREIMQQGTNALKALLDAGVIEVLLKMLVYLAHQRQNITEQCSGNSEQDTLITEIHLFLLNIVGLVLNMPSPHLMEVLKDVQFQLDFLQQVEVTSCGAESRCVKVLRCSQCTILEGSLDIIVGKLSDDSTHYFVRFSVPDAYELINPWSAKSRISSSTSNSSVSTIGSTKTISRAENKTIPRAELYDRFKTIVVKAVEFFAFSEPKDGIGSEPNSQEQNFLLRLLNLLVQGMCCVLERRSSAGNTNLWNSAMWAARDTLRLLTAQLLVWLLSPWQTVKLRMFTIQAIHSEPFAKDLLTSILNTHPKVEQKFTIWVWSLLYGPDARQLEDKDAAIASELTENLQRWGLLSPHIIGNPHDSWMGEIAFMLRETAQQRAAHHAHYRAARDRSVFKMENLHLQLIDAAMSATRNVVDLQNSERKAFMEHIKSAYSEDVQLRIKWQHLIQFLTHERAVWFFKDSYPLSWQLDATEGPARVRKRLQRCHLHIEPKFFKKSHRPNLKNAKRPGPLSFLFEKDTQAANASSVLVERLHTNEKIQHMCLARVITPSCEILGELLIGESSLYFVADTPQNDMEEVTAGGVDMSACAWQFDDVKEILNRRYQLKERAIEIFLANGRTHLLAFQSAEDRDAFLTELSQCELKNRISGDRLSETMDLWREGAITNWEYLMQLNKLAGRSYNDLMQYPVFPFVLSDYVSTVLDLTEPSSFRNFSKPMAIQNPANEQHYINYYNDWCEAMSPCQEPHHYGSHYSNSGTVLHFLLRLPPYTRMFVQYQDRKFDLADRTFHSLHTTWRLTSAESTTDVKELIPEFFFLTEFLVNNEGFDFGTRQNGERVDSVELPPWSNGNARTFILVHRQALESDYVGENLMHWIDLIFGYKQTGKAAVDAINVFHPATYIGLDESTIQHALDRTAWDTMVRTYGQTPRQLFKSPHPMVVQSLITRATGQSVRPVLNSVKGLVWGSYVGSPAEPEPAVAWKHTHRNPVANLVSLQTNDVFGLAPNTTILLNYSIEKGHAPSVQGVALVTWGHSDSIVRVKLKKEQPPWPVIRASDLDPITLCASAPDCAQLWVGYTSGRITVHRYVFQAARQQLDFSPEPINLFGHTGPILDLCLCRSFSIAVSASQDGSANIWDLNNLSYVRTIWLAMPKVERPVTLCCVSETLGDIVTVCPESKSPKRSANEANTYCPWDTTIQQTLSGTVEPGSSPPSLSDDWEIVAEPQRDNRRPVRSSSWSALKGLPKLRQWQARQRASSQGKDEKCTPTLTRGSVMFLHSINASYVGKITTNRPITAVCFSTAPEGVSVNVIATGLASGIIRLWSSWDLSPVRDISSPAITHPIISLAYSRDSQHLYASTAENVVIVWETGGSKSANKAPKFLNVTYL